MFQSVKLLIPAIIPSWRFFDIIAPSPRIEFRTLKTTKNTTTQWQEFNPRPKNVTFITMLKRMLWNPYWNETLFLMSCAERLIENPDEYLVHSSQEILTRIKTQLIKDETIDLSAMPYLQFRIACIRRDGESLKKEIQFTSTIYLLSEDTKA